MVVQGCNLSTWEGKQKDQRFKVIFSFISKVLGSLRYMRPTLNKILNPKSGYLPFIVYMKGGAS